MPGGRRNAASRTGATGKSGGTYSSSINSSGRSNSGERTIGNNTDDKKIDEIYNGRSLAPKHVPVPVVPVDGQLTFEIMSLAISVMTTCMQLLNIYKTVWWLPHSYNCYAMNFYLIDPYVLVFIFTIVARRVVYILLSRSIDGLSPVRWLPTIQKIMRMFLSVTVMSIISWCLYHLAEKHDLLKMFYLCYPLSIYFSMFGISLTPFFDISTSSSSGKEERRTKYLLDKPLHNCSLNASAIRAEVSTLKFDFNRRIKQALFASSGTAFICGAAPMIFAPPHLYFSRPWVIQQAILFWFGRMSAYFVHTCPIRYYDVLHRASLHLGRWVKIPNENRSNHAYNIQPWNDAVLWPHGSIVRHNREIYRSEGLCTAAEPGNTDHSRFHTFFYNPTVLLCSVLGAHLLLVGVQLLILLRTTEWCQLLSIALLLFMNYYTLFKIARDYLICWKVYRTEQIIQEKSQMVVNPVAQ
ncbi:transmembrane protein 39A-A isoform X2 [Harpegnathos saltator]|uniref:transmembrane protein 39A-A isoform X2 n=1 Tax=Harpegnathos saltator TaxID=610380 RepID=UPI00058C49BA|nr:transmembrane protein 39A-A isoform X2 [Harpegnathos saltator]